MAAPHIGQEDLVVLFDGVCEFCSAWTAFLVRRDPEARIKLCSIQSPIGGDLLEWAGIPRENVNTMLYIRKGRPLQKSDAFLAVLRDLGFPWNLSSVFYLVPRFIRNAVYSVIARNRYALFGKKDACMIPSPDVRRHFIG